MKYFPLEIYTTGFTKNKFTVFIRVPQFLTIVYNICQTVMNWKHEFTFTDFHFTLFCIMPMSIVTIKLKGPCIGMVCKLCRIDVIRFIWDRNLNRVCFRRFWAYSFHCIKGQILIIVCLTQFCLPETIDLNLETKNVDMPLISNYCLY